MRTHDTPHDRPARHRPANAAGIRELTHGECEAMLRRHGFGRLAYALHDRVWIEPISYAYDDGWLVGRTSAGSKLATLAHNPWVAMEIDDVRDTFDWRSVVAYGTFYPLHQRGTPTERRSWEHAVSLVRAVAPDALGPNDPAPFRDVLFHIHVDTMTGRTATPAPAGRRAPPALGHG